MWLLTLTVIVGVFPVGEITTGYTNRQDCETARMQAMAIADGLAREGLEYSVRGECVLEKRA